MRDALLEAFTLLTLATLTGLGLNQAQGLPIWPGEPFRPDLLEGRVRTISPSRALRERAFFVDARDRAAFGRGHLPGAVHDRLPPEGVPVIVYCSVGCEHATAVAEALQARGWSAQVLENGYEGWCAAGGAVER